MNLVVVLTQLREKLRTGGEQGRKNEEVDNLGQQKSYTENHFSPLSTGM